MVINSNSKLITAMLFVHYLTKGNDKHAKK